MSELNSQAPRDGSAWVYGKDKSGVKLSVLSMTDRGQGGIAPPCGCQSTVGISCVLTCQVCLRASSQNLIKRKSLK